MPTQDNAPELIAAWNKDGISAANSLALSYRPTGSNGWAIGPQKRVWPRHPDGKSAYAWGDNAPLPPADGLGMFQWMEVNLVVGDPRRPELNATGVVFVHAPFIAIGYSDDIGWTDTDNAIQNTNLFELTLNANGTYSFGGAVKALQRRTDIIKVLQPNGSLASQSIDIYASVHEPIIARRGKRRSPFASPGYAGSSMAAIPPCSGQRPSTGGICHTPLTPQAAASPTGVIGLDLDLASNPQQ
jgi:Penicillin amidase